MMQEQQALDTQRPRWMPWAGLALVALATTLPFLAKAFHTDDALYLAVARQILVRPWDPYGAQVLWEKVPEPLFDADFNPPLWSYLMAGVLAITGEPAPRVVRLATDGQAVAQFAATASRAPEIGMHLLESLFVVAALVALYRLGTRFVRWPLTAAAMVALSPALLPGQNVMLEGPVLAFWLGATWCHLRAIETRRWRWIIATGVLAALAVLTKYTSAVLLVVLGAYALRCRSGRSLWFLVLPAGALGLWSLHNLLVYERVHWLVIFGRWQTGERTPQGVDLAETWGRLFALLRALGAVTALAIPVAWCIARRYGGRGLLAVLALCLGIGWWGEHDMEARLARRHEQLEEAVVARTIGELAAKYSLNAHAIAFGFLGSILLGGLGLLARKQRGAGAAALEHPESCEPEFLLWVWVLAVAAFGVLATPFLAVRHLLPGIPPLVWLVLRRVENVCAFRPRSVPRVMLGCTVFVSAVCGFLVARADYDFANWYRHLALDVAARAVAGGRTKGKTIWFTGHWGWAYYAERAGMRPFVPGQSRMHAGDLLLMPLIQTWELPPRALTPYLKGLMAPIKPRPLLPVVTRWRMLNRSIDVALNSVRSISSEVHYYGGGTLNLPWIFSRKPMDDVTVIELRDEPDEE